MCIRDRPRSAKVDINYNLTAVVKGRKIRVYKNKYEYEIKYSENPAWVMFDFLSCYNAVSYTHLIITNPIDDQSNFEKILANVKRELEKSGAQFGDSIKLLKDTWAKQTKDINSFVSALKDQNGKVDFKNLLLSLIHIYRFKNKKTLSSGQHNCSIFD